jgi:hypothetical protein
VAFNLSFEPPGKARRRTPENWEDFSPHIIRLRDDRWTSESTDPKGAKHRGEATVKPMTCVYHSALLDALAITSTPGETTSEAWFDECVRRGLLPAIGPEDDRKSKEKTRSTFRAHKAQLVAAGWVGCDGERVFNLRAYTLRPSPR